MTDLRGNAHVQYDDWIGSLAGDVTDSSHLEDYFGVSDRYRLLAVDIDITGGRQRISAYGVPKDTSRGDLEALAASGDPILVKLVAEIEQPIVGHDDTNPPPPPHIPVQSVSELLVFGFKRLNLRLWDRSLPDGLGMVVDGAEPS